MNEKIIRKFGTRLWGLSWYSPGEKKCKTKSLTYTEERNVDMSVCSAQV